MKRLLATSLGLVLLIAAAHAADPVTRTKTGDRTLDGSLRRIDTQARGDLAGFMSMLSTKHSIPEDQIRTAQETHSLLPADLYMATAIARVTQVPVLTVAETYSKNPGRGWGVIAKDMGIKPGSPEFHQLKQGARGSLDHMKAEARAKQKHEKEMKREHEKAMKQEREHAKQQESPGEGRGKK